MIYIFETEILNNKSLMFSLQNIYGIGKQQSVLICKQLGLSKNIKTSTLSDDQILKLVKVIDKSDLIVASDLKKQHSLLLRNLVEIKSYKGLRRLKGLPVRGQRTHTNCKTSKRQSRLYNN